MSDTDRDDLPTEQPSSQQPDGTRHDATPRRRLLPRWARWTLAGVLAVLVCAVWGVTTARTEGSLGPNEATYAVTTDGEVTVDLGPLGTLVVDSPAPLNLGVGVTVHEIPAELTSLNQAQTLSVLGGDLDSYLQFFATPETTARRVATDLAVDAAWRTLGALVVVAAVGAAGFFLLGAARRRELGARASAHTGKLAVGTVVVLVAVVGLTASEERAELPPAESTPVLAGTPLEGARITGRLAGVIDTYGTQLIAQYRSSQSFYARADASLGRAFDVRDALDRAAGTSSGAAGTDGTGASAAPPTLGADLGAAALPTPSPDTSHVVTALVVSDLHCNTGMAPLITTAAERSGAQLVLDGGDTTINGTSVEQVCVDSFADAVPDGVKVVVSDGNHDSRLVSGFEKKRGWTVLDGSVTTVEGIRILGDRDVLETRIGVASRPSGSTTPAEQQQALADAACAARSDDGTPGVDLLLIHDPTIGGPALETGCVPDQVSGHLHRRIDPTQVGLGIRYVSSSTAGATLGQPTVGPLHGTAEMTVLRFDTQAHRILDWQLVQVTKKGVATVGPRQEWPTPSSTPVPLGPLPPGD
ncbi:metallophosphoesterase family protein [Luteimicrobium subarcticum]|uniref:Calcineurin-like phosphoesterase family protein n=1 Tax=Luteimicrobium subarcticum TaxID=620910 RepID=A0A2M8WVQ4_9MICO|nr:metallophosphoesterase family protein [Luteimicrobium subarcticum]PJI95001.1 calcineurin-like phosphoesterase family protein [Luteimicrobium subarcticum]